MTFITLKFPAVKKPFYIPKLSLYRKNRVGNYFFDHKYFTAGKLSIYINVYCVYKIYIPFSVRNLNANIHCIYNASVLLFPI